MRKLRGPWYRTTWFVGAARMLGIAELVGGLVLIVLRHDQAQGYGLLAIGAATIGSMPWVSRGGRVEPVRLDAVLGWSRDARPRDSASPAEHSRVRISEGRS